MKLIGISGVARSGKDLFTTVAQEVLKQHGLKTERFALAYELKSDLKDLIHAKTGIDVFTEKLELPYPNITLSPPYPAAAKPNLAVPIFPPADHEPATNI